MCIVRPKKRAIAWSGDTRGVGAGGAVGVSGLCGWGSRIDGPRVSGSCRQYEEAKS